MLLVISVISWEIWPERGAQAEQCAGQVIQKDPYSPPSLPCHPDWTAHGQAVSTANISHYLRSGADVQGGLLGVFKGIPVLGTAYLGLAQLVEPPGPYRGWVGQEAVKKVQQRRRDAVEEPVTAVAFWEADRYTWESGLLQTESTSSRADVGLICAGRSSPAVTDRAVAALAAVFPSGALAFFLPHRGEAGLQGCICHLKSPRASAELCVPAIKPC